MMATVVSSALLLRLLARLFANQLYGEDAFMKAIRPLAQQRRANTKENRALSKEPPYLRHGPVP